MFKKLISLALALCMFGCFAITSSAQDVPDFNDKILRLPICDNGETVKIPIGDAEYIDNGTGNLISISDLMSFETQEEADAYTENLKQQLKMQTQYNPVINFSARATHGDAVVASRSVATGSVKLHVNYTTSIDGNRGVITHHEAYTQMSGFTLGFDWSEDYCYTEVASSGKDIYAYAAGTLHYNLLVSGFIEVGRESVSLSGTCYAVR